jgi:hypothetical protein
MPWCRSTPSPIARPMIAGWPGCGRCAPDNGTKIRAVQADRARHIGYTRAVGRRRTEAKLEALIVSVPTEYTKRPMVCEGHESAGAQGPANRTLRWRADLTAEPGRLPRDMLETARHPRPKCATDAPKKYKHHAPRKYIP